MTPKLEERRTITLVGKRDGLRFGSGRKMGRDRDETRGGGGRELRRTGDEV